jgi:hypothetical protein
MRVEARNRVWSIGLPLEILDKYGSPGKGMHERFRSIGSRADRLYGPIVVGTMAGTVGVQLPNASPLKGKSGGGWYARKAYGPGSGGGG